MGNHDQAQTKLKQCVNSGGAKTKCHNDYIASENATVEGGKVFVTPDGEATFVTTGGKVFRGGKVF